MTLWQISEIKTALKDQIINIGKLDFTINQVAIDSRAKADNGLFVAFKGENNDGHNFLKQAFENGCVAAIVDHLPEGFAGDEKLILVKDSLLALEKLAIFSRSRSKAKIIAVTGSVGKTSVKEMLKTVFTSQGKTFATTGNLNNNFGLPLSLCNMGSDVEFGIFEMGMNHLGEIAALTKIAKPHIAIITTVAAAHIGNFKNEEEIALAKSEIFSGLVEGGFAVINADNMHYEFIKNQAINQQVAINNIINFGSKETSNIRLLAVEKAEDFYSMVTIFSAKSKQQISYLINTINQSTIFNSLIAVACLELIAKDFAAGLNSLQKLQTPKGRGNLIKVEKNGIKFTIIDDTYNANAASMQAGLKFLADLKNYQSGQGIITRAIAFVGDMLELGEFSVKEHKAIANYISAYNIDRALLVGDSMSDLISEIKPEKLIAHFQNSSLAAQNLNFQPQNGDIIFIKGSRGTKMEKLVEVMING
ncbi:MAG: UDP-N-acetylmuramoyl-tripeptide--D-alanyl-D-alanine ligase [Pseudomonadota bacterium]